MNARTPRFPFPRYPRGWFQVAYSDEIPVGQVVPLKYFGKDLVAFRAASGQLSVLDAFCPHLGAHLGHGGKVDGETLVCPFHSWKFAGSGECVEVPYAPRVPPRASVACWPVEEVNGLVMVWHDVDKAAPTWHVPVVPESNQDEWTPFWRRRWQLRTHNQEMAENVVDTAHFKYVHGMKIQPEPHIVEANSPHLKMVTKTIMETPSGDVGGELAVDCLGFGFSTSRFTGLVRTTVIASVTPIDDELVDVRFSFAVHKEHGADVAKGVGKAFIHEVARQLEEDKPIWENKVYLERPLLCDGDGPVGVYRRWCKTFYPEWYLEQAAAEYAAAHPPRRGAAAE
ncbi:MAG: Rieske 2Fe-2S domain-containing protein [Polyangiaceae bacterium]|nr:Rieske 2Fe-2S domain-containing protein [Polyangiaceae bacterium]